MQLSERKLTHEHLVRLLSGPADRGLHLIKIGMVHAEHAAGSLHMRDSLPASGEGCEQRQKGAGAGELTAWMCFLLFLLLAGTCTAACGCSSTCLDAAAGKRTSLQAAYSGSSASRLDDIEFSYKCVFSYRLDQRPPKHVKLRLAIRGSAAAGVGCWGWRGLHVLGSCSWTSPARPASASCSTWEVSCSSRASPCVGDARALISHPSSRATGSASCCGLRAAVVMHRHCLQSKKHVCFAKMAMPCTPSVSHRWLGDGCSRFDVDNEEHSEQAPP